MTDDAGHDALPASEPRHVSDGAELLDIASDLCAAATIVRATGNALLAGRLVEQAAGVLDLRRVVGRGAEFDARERAI